MILVLVGTSSWDFLRLIKEMDRIAGLIGEDVVMQISDTEYKPKNAKYFKFTSGEEIETLYREARLVVTHAGVGCILSAFRYGKPLIIVPRRKAFNEHFDDHQSEIAEELAREKGIDVVWNIQDLEKLLSAYNGSQLKYEQTINPLREKLQSYITSLEG